METDLAKLQKFMPKSNKEKTILLLESLKDPIPFLYKGNSIAFASKTLEVVKKAVGDKSHQYFALEALMYDNTLHKLKGQIIPVDSLIVGMINNNKVNFDGLIDSCIENVKLFGLYKSPSEKKNILGDFDNATLIGIFTIFTGLIFAFGYGYCKFNIEKYEKGQSEFNLKTYPQEVQQQRTPSTQPLDTIQKNHKM